MTSVFPIRTVVPFVLLVSGGGAVAATPSFDCAKADSSAEEAICASDALAELDIELARLYRLAVKDDTLGADRLAELKAMQRGWIHPIAPNRRQGGGGPNRRKWARQGRGRTGRSFHRAPST